MSYLDPTRLHFAGQFQANVSTVNNDPRHFDNASFTPQDQQMGSNGGWWNPQGSGDWRLLGCAVTSAFVDGAAAAPSDALIGSAVADSDEAAPAKLVDLDPQQQLVSQVWGLTVRIVDTDGNELMSGDFVAAPFTNLWSRAVISAGGDMNMGACWQSVLENVTWADDLSHSPALQALKAKTFGDKLSIKFNVDGYNMDYAQPDFTCGRIVGTIGPYLEGEPNHFLIARQLIADPDYTPSVPPYLYNGQIHIDTASNTLLCDLGNSIPTQHSGEYLADIGALTIGWHAGGFNPNASTPIDVVYPQTYTAPGWYEQSAGIVALPLDPDQVAAATGRPLVITADSSANSAATRPIFAIREDRRGLYVRADQFVVRMSPGDTPETAIYATRLGRPLPNAPIVFAPDNGGLQGGGSYLTVGTPDAALVIPGPQTTDANGKCTMRLSATDPGHPRWKSPSDFGLDGQLYGIRPIFNGVDPEDPALNSWDFVSVHLYSAYAAPNDPPTWADIQPIMQQYANLYPVMARFLDLADEDSVKGNLWLLKLAFQLPRENPNHMPVTRDLSVPKRDAIVKYLETVGSESAGAEAVPRPPLKTPPGGDGAAEGPVLASVSSEEVELTGGKTQAMANRIGAKGDDQ